MGTSHIQAIKYGYEQTFHQDRDSGRRTSLQVQSVRISFYIHAVSGCDHHVMFSMWEAPPTPPADYPKVLGQVPDGLLTQVRVTVGHCSLGYLANLPLKLFSTNGFAST